MFVPPVKQRSAGPTRRAGAKTALRTSHPRTGRTRARPLFAEATQAVRIENDPVRARTRSKALTGECQIRIITHLSNAGRP